MSRLSQGILEAVKAAGVRAVRLDRYAAAVWDKDREAGDPVTYVGWYWHRVDRRGRVVDYDRSGPFPCESAAKVDAFKVLQLSVKRRG